MLVNMNSILKTVEDAYDEVDHLVTKTILKFIGLKMTQKCLPKLLRVIVDQAKVFPAGTEAAQIRQSNEYLNNRTTQNQFTTQSS